MKKKRILTIDDLYSFYSTHQRFSTFSAEKSGYQVAVQVPFSFETNSANVETDDYISVYPVRAFHLGVNRNQSNVSKESAEKAIAKMAYKPILADFVQYLNKETGETITDFGSHAMVVSEDGETINYIERQVGCFTADAPTFEEVDGKTFINAKIAIPSQYTQANDIIVRKGGTKCSVELGINLMSYDPKSGILNLEDFDVMGMTLLGVRLDEGGNPVEVQEGMEGAKVSLKDFAQSKNSLFSSIDEEANAKLIETLEALNTTLQTFNTESSKKGGNDPLKLNELLEKYSVTVEDLTFDYENMNDEELETAFEEAFADVVKGKGSSNQDSDSIDSEEEEENPAAPDASSSEPEASSEEASEESSDDSDDGAEFAEDDDEDDDKDDKEEDADDDEKEPKKDYENEELMVRTYKLSHDDIRYALYELIGSVEEQLGNYVYIMTVYDDSFIFGCGNDYYRMSYTREGDNVALNGEPTQVFAEFITAQEKSALDLMRATYEDLKAFKDNYDLNASRAEKKEVLENECYSSIAETAEFVELMKDENLDKFSKEEIEKEANAIVGKYAVQKFSLENHAEPTKKKVNMSVMFAAQKHESSFLEGLLAIGKQEK